MTEFSGSYDASVQTVQRVFQWWLDTHFYTQTLVPTFLPHSSALNPTLRDLYLNTPKVTFLGSNGGFSNLVQLDIPFISALTVNDPNVHGTVTLTMPVIELNGNVGFDPFLINGGVTVAASSATSASVQAGVIIALQEAFFDSSLNSKPLLPNSPAAFGFAVNPGVLHVFASADKGLHGDPPNPPDDLDNSNFSWDFEIQIDAAAVLNTFNAKVAPRLAQPLVTIKGKNINLESLTLVINEGSMNISGAVTGAVSFSQDIGLWIDSATGNLGVTPLGAVEVSDPILSDVVNLFAGPLAPIVNDAIIDSLTLTIRNALPTILPGPALKLFGLVLLPSPDVMIHPDRLQVIGTIDGAPRQHPVVPTFKNPKLPRLCVDERTRVFHALPCYWGDAVSARWGNFDVEHDATTIANLKAGGFNGCYLCLPKFHKKNPGTLTTYFRVLNAQGFVSGKWSVDATLLSAAKPVESGDSAVSVDHEFASLPDSSGAIIVHATEPSLAAGEWRFVISSSLDPSWTVTVTQSLDAWDPLTLYLTLGSPDAVTPY